MAARSLTVALYLVRLLGDLVGSGSTTALPLEPTGRSLGRELIERLLPKGGGSLFQVSDFTSPLIVNVRESEYPRGEGGNTSRLVACRRLEEGGDTMPTFVVNVQLDQVLLVCMMIALVVQRTPTKRS